MTTTEAKQYDQGMWFLERWRLRRLRRQLLAGVQGNVLEIGAGTGANLPVYDAGIDLTLVDINRERLVGTATKNTQRPFHLTCANAEQLPFAGHQFDAVVGTLVFCSIPHPLVALAEIRRVLRPDGRLLLLEHTRGHGPISRRLTDWLHPLWFALQGECHLNRETAQFVQQAGFTIQKSSVHGLGILQMITAVLK